MSLRHLPLALNLNQAVEFLLLSDLGCLLLAT